MEKNRYSVPALEKGLAILELLAEASAPLGVTDINERCGLPKSTVFMILNTLESLDYVRKQEDGKYRPTLKLYHVGNTVLGKLDVRRTALPHMRRLAAATRFTVHLAMLENGKALYIEKVNGPGFVQFSTQTGQTQFLHNSGVGKALAAYLPEAQLDACLARHGMPAPTANTITDPAAFKRFLAAVREQGYAIEDEEDEPGIRCMAAPVFGHTGEAVASLGVTALRNELPVLSFPETGRLVRDIALDISRELGYKPAE